MNELHRRINKVINTMAFEACLTKNGVDLVDFQSDWVKLSQGGHFDKLPQAYRDAIEAGESELEGAKQVVFA